MQITRAITTADDGFIIINKQKNMTSHDVVSCMRKLCNTRKVGHGGTLDPMATGVLVIAVGKATRMLQYIAAKHKTYKATILLGVSTVSDDAMGEILQITPVQIKGLQEKIFEALKEFRGEIMQAPSKVSAIKIDGKRAYDLVREGKEVQLKQRPVTIYSLEQTCALKPNVEYDNAYEFDIEVTCSSGTYIRSIARDLGEKLGVGAHLTMLERTSVGNFVLDQSQTLSDLDTYVTLENSCESPKAVEVIKLHEVAKNMFPYAYISEDERQKICVGGFLSYKEFTENLISENSISIPNDKNILAAVYKENGEEKLVALMEPKGKYVKPVCVFDVLPPRNNEVS